MSTMLEGKVVIVTGSGGGIGRDMALAMAQQGAKVVVNDIGTSTTGEGHDDGPAQKVVNEIKAAGGDAVANTDTVSDANAAAKIVQCALDSFGKLSLARHHFSERLDDWRLNSPPIVRIRPRQPSKRVIANLGLFLFVTHVTKICAALRKGKPMLRKCRELLGHPRRQPPRDLDSRNRLVTRLEPRRYQMAEHRPAYQQVTAPIRRYPMQAPQREAYPLHRAKPLNNLGNVVSHP
jgi:hypothetical protein